jgi:hypothetical protein
MKNLLPLVCITLLCMFVSCDDEKIQLGEKNKGPVITLVQPAPADSYSGEIVIEATATGRQRIVSMEIAIDNVVIASSDNDSILYILNSAEYEDGLHALTITAKDKKGTSARLEAAVQFSNSFITLNMVVNVQEPGTQYYYFLNDADGNVVSDLKQVTPTTTEVKFSTPAGHTPDKKYGLAYVEHWPSYYGYNAVTTIQVVTGYSAGTYNEMIGTPFPPPPAAIGTHTVNFVDFNDPIVQAAFHTEVGSGFIYNISGLDLPLERNGADAFVAVKRETDAAPLYKILTGINAGETTSYDPSQFSPMSGVTLPSAPGARSTFAYVNAFKTAGDYTNPRIVWINYPFGGGPMDYNYQLYHPGNEFPEYLTGLFEGFDDHTDEFLSFGQTTPTEFKRVNGQVSNVSKTSTGYAFQTEGSYDFLQFGISLITTWSAYSDYSFSVILPNGDLSYDLPQVPQEVTDMFGFPPLSTWEAQYAATYVGDYSALNGYDDYFDATYTNAGTVYDYNNWGHYSREFTSRSSLFFPSSARIGTSRTMPKNYFARSKSAAEKFEFATRRR